MRAAAAFCFLVIALEGKVQTTLAIMYNDSDCKNFVDEIGSDCFFVVISASILSNLCSSRKEVFKYILAPYTQLLFRSQSSEIYISSTI